MSHTIANINRRYRRVFLLLGVYALHLVYFQALMGVTPGTNSEAKRYKPLFAVVNKTKPQQSKPIGHPALVYYSIMLKAANIDVRALNFAPHIATHIEELFVSEFLSPVQKLVAIPVQLSHFGNVLHCCCCYLQVFLI